MPRALTLAFASLLSASVLAAPAAAQDPAPAPSPAPSPEPAPARIAQGITVAGVDVSNLTLPEATERLEAKLADKLNRPIQVAVAGSRYTLTLKTVRFSFSASSSARRAYIKGREHPPSEGNTKDVEPFVEFRHGEVRQFAERVERRTYVAPRNASARITVRHIYRRRSRAGRDLDAKALRRSIEAALVDPEARHLLKPGRATLKPAVTSLDIARRYRTVITVNRSTFKLRLFKSFRLSKTYGVAVGAEGYDTPARLYSVTSRQVNPPWTAPNKPWAGIYRGRTVGGGSSENPLKARWLGLADGVGIHGTGDEGSIGSRASHGCIRMRVRDVKDLYPRVPLGTPVLIR